MLYPATPITEFTKCKSFLVMSLESLMSRIKSLASYCLYFFVSYLYPIYFLSCLTTLDKTSSFVLNMSREDGDPSLFFQILHCYKN